MNEVIADVRRFNRYYTGLLGLLDEGLLDSPFTLTEVRVLFELAHRREVTSTELAQELRLDAGYLSRILKRFEANELVKRRTSEDDGRQSFLSLTAAGRRAYAPLDRATDDQIARLIEPLSEVDRTALVASMQRVQSLLSSERAGVSTYVLRDLASGDIGWITHRQGVLYRQEYGWDETYEALVAEILADFVRTRDPDRERAWVAESQGRIVGSVFLVRASEDVAKLRLLYVEPDARGMGLGAHLVRECVEHARALGYRTLTLWTQTTLTSARRIYEAAGFTRTKAEAHHSFGHDLVAETWDLAL